MKRRFRLNLNYVKLSIVVFEGFLISLLVVGCGGGSITQSTSPHSGTTPPTTGAPIIVQASQSSVQVNNTVAFTATQQNVPVTGGQWVVPGGSANGTIDPNGRFLAPASVPAPSTVTVEYLLAGQTYSGSVTVVSATTAAPIIVQASQYSVQANNTVDFTVTQQNVPVTGGQWLVLGGNANGTIDPNGRFHAPASVPAPATVTVEYLLAGQTYTGSVTIVSTAFPTISIQPSTLVGGNVSIALSGSHFAPGDVVFLGGSPLTTTVASPTEIKATGFLTPWTSGNVLVELRSGDGTSTVADISVPISPTATTFDAAARFTTQAAFGPRSDLVQHIQTIGFDAFITEQFQQAPVNYSLNNDGRRDFILGALGAMSGNSLLRQRVALGLQSFLVSSGNDFSPSQTCYESKLETDVTGNFRQILNDVANDPNVGDLLNLIGNQASTSLIVQPNQNFARELMQLFSLGPMMLNDDGSAQLDDTGNPIPTYTQDTVIDLTRALTGWNWPVIANPATTMWGIDYCQPLAGNDSLHDHNAKLLFGAVVLPAGQSITQDRDMALDAIFNHPNLPPFISHLLIQRLVKSNPSPEYIKRISSVFEDDGSGVRGNMAAVIRAILLDPEARLGDSTPSPSDGFLQEPLLFQLFAMNAVSNYGSDDQGNVLPNALGEPWWVSPTVFGYYSPSYNIPGTTINSPEFMLLNNVSVIQRSQALWGIVTAQQPGFTIDSVATSWLMTNFTTVPSMVDALNHLLYHGQMSQQQQAQIIRYCSQLNPFDTNLQLRSAIFLALNGDSYNVSN
jgi:uncharacterized protein (DUF1800 family)